MSGARAPRDEGGRPGRKELEIRVDLVQVTLIAASLAVVAGFLAWGLRSRGRGESSDTTPSSRSARDAGEPVDVSRQAGFFEKGDGPAPGAARPSISTAGPRELAQDAAQPVSGAARFSVQVFAGDRAGAEALRRRLSERGEAARIVAEGGVARVRVGSFPTREQARAAARGISARHGLETWVVEGGAGPPVERRAPSP